VEGRESAVGPETLDLPRYSEWLMQGGSESCPGVFGRVGQKRVQRSKQQGTKRIQSVTDTQDARQGWWPHLGSSMTMAWGCQDAWMASRTTVYV
jgi:hypothetical protein